MKKLILTLLAITICHFVFAQKADTTFYGSYLKKTYHVRATKPNARGKFDFEVEMQSIDKLSPEIYFTFQSRVLPRWKTTMAEVKHTYLKWRNAAIENKVEKASKIIKECGITSYLCSPVFKYGSWHTDHNHPIYFTFQVSGDDINLVIATGAVYSSRNRYIQTAGGIIVLSSEEEIDNFIACLDDKWVYDYYDRQKNTEALFK